MHDTELPPAPENDPFEDDLVEGLDTPAGDGKTLADSAAGIAMTERLHISPRSDIQRGVAPTTPLIFSISSSAS